MIFNFNKEIIVEEIKDEGLLLYNEETKETHILNETAMYIFDLCINNDFDGVIKEYVDHFCADDGEAKGVLIGECLDVLGIFIKKDIFYLTCGVKQ